MDNAFYLSGQRVKSAAFQQFPGRREKRTSEKVPLLGGGLPAIALHIRYDRIENLQSQLLEKKSVLMGQPLETRPSIRFQNIRISFKGMSGSAA